jgi:Coenzyme PQQ synthesis protein D (PqqD)
MTESLSRTYRVNAPQVLHEAFEDETVLINLDSGNYYSFSGSGALIWDCIVRGASIGSVIENLQERFGTRDGIAPGVDDFVSELVKENLIVEDSSSAAKNVEEARAKVFKPAQFERPVLQKYSDMQDLLLLDPIHEVDEMGWPHALPPEPGPKPVE